MKRISVVVVLAVALVALSASWVRSQKSPELHDFMRAKLEHSKKIIEGLTTDDFEMIAKSSQELSLLTQAETWQVIQTPDYLQHSTEFRRSADALRAAAQDKNIDGAALAYMEVTLKCVNCHKYVRRVRMADFQEPSLAEQLAPAEGAFAQ
jgi:hypothetical protein